MQHILELPHDPVEALVDIIRYLSQELFYTIQKTGLKPPANAQLRASLNAVVTKRWTAAALGTGRDPIDLALKHVITFLAGHGIVRPHDRWQRIEITLNARARAFFALIGPAASKTVVQQLIPDLGALPPLHVAKVESTPERHFRRVGKPDALLAGQECLIVIEMKVRGAASRCLYEPAQLTRYLKLAQLARGEAGTSVRVAHLILCPANARCFAQETEWIDAVDASGRVTIRPLEQFGQTLGTIPIVRKSYDLHSALV